MDFLNEHQFYYAMIFFQFERVVGAYRRPRAPVQRWRVLDYLEF